MNIGIEAQRLFREQKHGMDFVALELIRALQKLDKVNNYFIFVNTGPDRCIQETPNFRIISFNGWYPVWEQIKLPSACKKYAVDLLHCTSNMAPLAIGIPIVVTFHDIIFFESGILFKKGFTPYQRFGNLYRKVLARRILRKADRVITVSHCEKKLLLKLPGIDSKRVEVVYNAVGNHFRKKISPEEKLRVKEKYHLPDSFIMFLGNTDPKKNSKNAILGFIEFCEKHGSGISLVIADLKKPVVHGILRENGKEEYMNQMRFPGYINNGDMPAVIQQSKIFMYPSKRESFGIPIIEAMTCRVPVITSNAFSMPEVAGKAAFYIHPESISSIAEGISEVMSNDELRFRLISEGGKRRRMYSWEKSAKKMHEIYMKVGKASYRPLERSLNVNITSGN